MTTSAAARRRRRVLLIGGSAVLVVAVSAVVAWLLLRPEPAAGGNRADDAAGAAAALRDLAVDPESLVAAQAGPEAAAAARSGVPEGTEVTPDPGTWQPDGVGGGVMEVRLDPPDEDPVTYLAVMVREEAGWKVLATLPVESAPAAGTSPAEPTS